jgi:hypothetical protein
MAHPMVESETAPTQSSSAAVLSHCPECHAPLAILCVMAGSAGSEYDVPVHQVRRDSSRYRQTLAGAAYELERIPNRPASP